MAHTNLRVNDLVEVFRDLAPGLKVQHLDVPEPDNRDYRVSTARLSQAGFSTRVSMEIGVAEIVDAISVGLIPDPQALYYRNAKWLQELSQIGSKNHRDIMSLMEVFGGTRKPSAPFGLAA